MPWPFSSKSSDDDKASQGNVFSSLTSNGSGEQTSSKGWVRVWLSSSSSRNNKKASAETASSAFSSDSGRSQPSDSPRWLNTWPFSHPSSSSGNDLTLSPTQTALLILTISTLSITTYRFRRYYFRHHPNALSLSPTFYARRRALPGMVTTVGDGDNFRLYHTPGGRLAGYYWLHDLVQSTNNIGYLRRWPSFGKNKQQRLKGDETIHIRLAGVDAPELGHWGNATQPGAQEALEWLKSYVLGRRVRVTALKADQYNRVVGTVKVWRFPWVFGRKDVSLEMLKAGKAGLYEANSGVEFGGYEAEYRRAEEQAKRKRLGVWGRGMRGTESPREYKNRVKKKGEEGMGPGQEQGQKVEERQNANTKAKGAEASGLSRLLSMFSRRKKR